MPKTRSEGTRRSDRFTPRAAAAQACHLPPCARLAEQAVGADDDRTALLDSHPATRSTTSRAAATRAPSS